MGNLHILTKEDIAKSTNKRIRKPNKEGKFFCHDCKTWKSKNDFTKQKRNIHGVGSYCKKCKYIRLKRGEK